MEYYNEDIGYMNCSMVLSLKNKFLKGGYDNNLLLKEDVLHHLCSCDSCRNAYLVHSIEKFNRTFNIYKEIKKLVTDYQKGSSDKVELKYHAGVGGTKPSFEILFINWKNLKMQLKNLMLTNY